jgi:hypothetical protein
MTHDSDFDIDRAIRFLSAAIERSGHNLKPVVLHSVRVGLILDEYRYGWEVVVAGVLHDILEDTAETAEELTPPLEPRSLVLSTPTPSTPESRIGISNTSRALSVAVGQGGMPPA